MRCALMGIGHVAAVCPLLVSQITDNIISGCFRHSQARGQMITQYSWARATGSLGERWWLWVEMSIQAWDVNRLECQPGILGVHQCHPSCLDSSATLGCYVPYPLVLWSGFLQPLRQ